MKTTFTWAATAMMLLAGCTPDSDKQTITEAERGAVLQPIEALFDAMADRDPVAGTALIHNRGMGIAITADGPDSGNIRALPLSELVASFATASPPVRERIWDAEIRIDGPLATVWAPYDFWLDDALHHCGTNAFQLMRDGETWRVINVAWTRREKTCGDSPLEAPGTAGS